MQNSVWAAFKKISLILVCLIGIYILLSDSIGLKYNEFKYYISGYTYGQLDKRKGQALKNWAKRWSRVDYYNIQKNQGNRGLEASPILVDLKLNIEDAVFAKIKKRAHYFFSRSISGPSRFEDFHDDLIRNWYPAKLTIGERTYSVKIKLRGINDEHYVPNHFSFRVKFPKKDLWNGYRVINLIVNYDKKVFLNQVVGADYRQQGGTYYRQDYGRLAVNGVTWGIYYIFGNWNYKDWANQGRSEGAIIRGNKKIESGKRSIAKQAQANLDALQNLENKLSWDEVRNRIDIHFSSLSMAWAELLFDYHTLVNLNVFYFYEPSRGVLEQILYDFSPRLRKIDDEFKYRREFKFLDRYPEFRHFKNKHIHRLVSSAYEGLILPTYKSYEDKYGEIFKLDRFYGPKVYTYHLEKEKNIIEKNVQVMKQRLEMVQVASQDSVLQNNSVCDVVISQVSILYQGRQKTDKVNLENPIRLYGRDSLSGFGEYKSVGQLQKLKSHRIVAVKGENLVTGDAFEVQTGGELNKEIELKIAENKAPRNLTNLGRVSKDQIVIGPGVVKIKGEYKVPEHFRVQIVSNTKILFSKGAKVLLRGPLEALGTAGRPIVLRGENDNNKWSFAVQGESHRKVKVKLNQIHVRGGHEGKFGRVRFSSPFSIHDGDIKLSNSSFLGATGEDGVNFKYSIVDIRNSIFGSSKADDQDALDCDFCKGYLENNYVTESSGDGFDFSGATVTIHNNYFSNINDKAISVGEGTNLKMTKTYVDQARTGVAVKDGSEVELKTFYVKNTRVGISAYKKKLHFGAPKLAGTQVYMKNMKTLLSLASPNKMDLQQAQADNIINFEEYFKARSKAELENDFSESDIGIKNKKNQYKKVNHLVENWRRS